jgi:hypothetical protein
VEVGSGVRVKTDVNADGSADDKADTRTLGGDGQAINNCFLLYGVKVRLGIPQAAGSGALAEEVVELNPQNGVCQLWRTHACLTRSVDL